MRLRRLLTQFRSEHPVSTAGLCPKHKSWRPYYEHHKLRRGEGFMAYRSYWTCPFCETNSTLTSENRSIGQLSFDDGAKEGALELHFGTVTCPNKKCREYEIKATLRKPHSATSSTTLQTWSLRPQSHAKVFPDYIPGPIREDYEEACAILDLSPKASATLSRRCLQGIIRNFWGVSKARLVDEIDELNDRIDPSTWAAIDAVRKIGNIGAHMEKDINLVIEVEPSEAKLLTGLIEILLADWYVARKKREDHLAEIVALGKKKDDAKAEQGSNADK